MQKIKGVLVSGITLLFLFLASHAVASDIYIKDLEQREVFYSQEINENTRLSRGDFLILTLKNKGFNPDKYDGYEPFKDILPEDEISPFVQAAYEAGALREYTEYFQPHKKISRLEAIKIVFAIEGISPYQNKKSRLEEKIKDLPTDALDRAFLMQAYLKGYIKKTGDKTLSPYKRITYKEASRMLSLVFRENTRIQNSLQVTDIEKTQQIIEKYYLDAENIENTQLEDSAIAGMIDSLDDPYSVFFPPEDSESFESVFEDGNTSEYVGIGVSVEMLKDGLIINEVFEGSPAQKSGLLSGDIITHVDGESIAGKTASSAVENIKGPEGTAVNITINRKGVKYTKKVTREKIIYQIPPTVSAEIKDDILWVTVRSFGFESADIFKDQLEFFLGQNDSVKGIVIDLRDNPGGILETSQKMLGEILPKKTVFVVMKKKEKKTPITVKGSGKYTQLPMVVIINENSASASEIFSGAIQDTKRGTIIGKTSFGKGVAQKIFPLSGGRSLKITTQEFLTPKENPVHEMGIIPDIEVDTTNELKILQTVKKLFSSF